MDEAIYSNDCRDVTSFYGILFTTSDVAPFY